MTTEPTAGDRLRWLRRTASRWIVVILLLVVATVVGASWTFGLFSTSSANPRNTISAGSMTQDNTAGNAAIMRAVGMVPGDVIKGTATIENVGDASGDFTLRVRDVTDDPGPNGAALSSWLKLKVFEGDRALSIWSGPLGELHVDLGTWQPGEDRSYRFEITFPAKGAQTDNGYQRSRATATFEWNAVQSH